MRYRMFGDGTFGFELQFDRPDYPDPDDPLVHVFRDDELDELADAIIDVAWNRGAILDVLRNHGGE